MNTRFVDKLSVPIDYKSVKIEDHFWSPRLHINRKHSIPHQYQKCKDTGRIDAFKLNWKPGMEEKPHIFWVAQVSKWIEAASLSIATDPDTELETLLNEVVDLVISAQQPDGYLNIYFTVVEPEKRWTDLRDAHELFVAGHLIEAGVAHYQSTGSRKLLDVVCRFTDHIDSLFGDEPGKKRGYPGHQEIELALIKLYRVTGEDKHLHLSRYFIEERGSRPNYFAEEEKERNTPGFYDQLMNHEVEHIEEHNQSHLPVREQDRAVGHAVRALYMYCAMADLAYELKDDSLMKACERLWANVYQKHIYFHGGVGQQKLNEGFSYDYDLPNETAYAETCASIGMVFWAHRMLQLDCNRRYSDVMEHVLYNGVLSGISLDGKGFFYENRLMSEGDFHRKNWFDCACCPPNVARLFASIGSYIYSVNENELAVHLYIQNTMQFEIKEQKVKLSLKTEYPWNGSMHFSLDLENPETFSLKLRIPEWCKKARLVVNGEIYPLDKNIVKGYVKIERLWEQDDEILLDLEMEVTKYYCHPNVRQNVGCVALQRGPLVYCVEGVDHNNTPLQTLFIPQYSKLKADFVSDLLGGVVVLKGDAVRAETDGEWEKTLYSTEKPTFKDYTVVMIPYYAWDNREPGQMRIWMHEI